MVDSQPRLLPDFGAHALPDSSLYIYTRFFSFILCQIVFTFFYFTFTCRYFRACDTDPVRPLTVGPQVSFIPLLVLYSVFWILDVGSVKWTWIIGVCVDV